MAADPWALFGSDSDEDQTTAMVSLASIAARRLTTYRKPTILVSFLRYAFPVNIQPYPRKQVVTADRAMAQGLLPLQALVMTGHCLLAEAVAAVATACSIRLFSSAVLPVRMFVLLSLVPAAKKLTVPPTLQVLTWYLVRTYLAQHGTAVHTAGVPTGTSYLDKVSAH